MFSGKTIILAVSGGIAAYKAAILCSKLTRQGAHVKVIMTESAKQFIQPLTFQAISRFPVYCDTFDEQDASVIAHIDLADSADIVLIAPATANIIAKLATGQADDMLTTTCLATSAPLFIAPAMNVHMYAHPAVQANMQLLQQRGASFIEPGEGPLACGYNGKGRLAEPELIIDQLSEFLRQQEQLNSDTQSLKGKKLLVTAGGTRERIDPVRYIGNDSSGKMGFAIAEAAVMLGMEVVLITGPSHEVTPPNVRRINVESTQQMYDEVLDRYTEADLVIKSAAVADYRPIVQHEHKIKKTESKLTIELERTPDILKTLGEKQDKPYLVGFAAETQDLDIYAMKKLVSKNCDMIVANDVTLPDAGFDKDTNQVRIFNAEGEIKTIPTTSKKQIAVELLQLIAKHAF